MKVSRPEVASGAPAPVAAAGAASSSSLAVDADGPGLPDPARRACPLNADCIEIVVEYAASVRDALPLRLVAGRWRGAVDSVVVQLNGRQRRAVGLAAPQDAAGAAPSAGLQRHWRADRGDVLLRVAATGCRLEAVEHVTGYVAHQTMLSSAQCAYAVAVRCPNLRRLVFTGEMRDPMGEPASPLLPVQIKHLMQRCPLLSDLTGVAANDKAALLKVVLRHRLELEHLDVSLVAPSTTVRRPKGWYPELLKDVIHANRYTLRQATVRRDVVRTPLAHYREIVACIARCPSLDALRLEQWHPEDAVAALTAPVLDDDGEEIGSCASRLACFEVAFEPMYGNVQLESADPLAELLQHCTSLTTLRLVWTGHGVPVGAPEIAALEPVRRAIRQLPCLTNIDAPGFPLLGAGLEPVLPSASAVAAAFATEQALPDSAVLTTTFGLDPSIVTKLHLDVVAVTAGIMEAMSRFHSLQSLAIRKVESFVSVFRWNRHAPTAACASIAPLVALRGTLQSLTLDGFDREFNSTEAEGCFALLTELHTLQLDNQPCPSPLLLAASLPKLRVLRASEITLRSESDAADFFRLLPRLEIVDTIIVPGDRAACNYLNPMAQHRHVKLWSARNTNTANAPLVDEPFRNLLADSGDFRDPPKPAAIPRPSRVAPQLWVRHLDQLTFTTESYTTSAEREPEPAPERAPQMIRVVRKQN